MESREFVVKDPITGKFASFTNVTDHFTSPFLNEDDFIMLMASRAYVREVDNIKSFLKYGYDSCGIHTMDYKDAIDRYQGRNPYGMYSSDYDVYPVDIENGVPDRRIIDSNKDYSKKIHDERYKKKD